MASWIASSTKGDTLGRFKRLPDMVKAMPKRLRVGDRFRASSSQGTRIVYEITSRGVAKIETYIPKARRRSTLPTDYV